jgi:hypothetical protein
MLTSFNNKLQFAPVQDTKTTVVLKGGEWLVKETNAFDTFIREDFTEEQLMIMDMCRQYVRSEILPCLTALTVLNPD